MEKLELMRKKLELMAQLSELYEVGNIANRLGNLEMQTVLMDRISTKKGEIEELERELKECIAA